MKFLLTTLVLIVGLIAGCATRQPAVEPAFGSVPGPSAVDQSLGDMATVTTARVYESKEMEKESRSARKKREAKAAADKPIIAPDLSLSGKVVSYNDAGQFVVLSFPSGQLPFADQWLSVYRNNFKVGELKTTTWQRGDNVVADIVTGEARAGDEVRDK